MKRICRHFLISSILLAAFSALPVLCEAQTDPGDPGTDPDAPIDGGISILLAAGVCYGIKRANDQRKRNKEKAIEFPKQDGL